jgi:flagellum-specific peptidoglycan hydrolase FlgJ
MPSKLAKDRTKLFIKNYGKDIATAIAGTGLYFSAVVGQKCGESAYGTSNLAKKYNNFGGIRNFGSLQGAVGTTSSGYAIFRTPLDCFKVYVSQLQSPNKKYTKNGVFTAPSPEEQIKRMVNSGYSTTPASQYLSLCQSAIDSAREIVPLGRITNLTASLSQIQTSTI